MDEFVIVRKNGRDYAVLTCDQCDKEFARRLDVILRDGLRNKSCSSACANKLRSNAVVMTCQCGKEFERNPNQIERSQSGKLFCSKACSNKENNAARSGELHPLYKGGSSTYRERALEHYGEACTVCAYAIVSVLEVHHRDGDRSHNEIENLDVLCPTHHTEFEVGVRIYEGMGSRLIGKTAASEAANMGSMPVSPTKFLM